MKLTVKECDELDQSIERLSGEIYLSPRDAEQIFVEILSPLMRIEGFNLIQGPRLRDGGVDIVGERQPLDGSAEPERCGIEIKYYRSKVGMNQVRALIGAALVGKFNRAILVSNSDFTREAHRTVSRELPLKIELVGLSELKNWVARFRSEEPEIESEVRIILRDLSEKLARLIARDKNTLAHLEWRDVERVVAEVFNGLGFRVTLTPGSKDGGKDVVLTCTVLGRSAEYYVEVKHWRSSTKVGASAVEKLLKVVVEEKKDGGMFLSTYGFTSNAFEQLTTIDKQKLRFGDQDRIVTFCQTYVKATAGLWSPPENLGEVLFDE